MRHEMSLRGGIFNDAVDLFDTKLPSLKPCCGRA